MSTAQAADLDLGNLAKYNYSGKSTQGGGCSLTVSAIAKDFSGRIYQDFRAWVDGHADLNFNIRLRGGDRSRSPLRIVNGNPVYSIIIDIYNLELTTDPGQPALVKEFRLIDTTAVGGSPNGVIECQSVSSSPR